METAINWLTANWSNIFAVIGILVTAATGIVKITPSQKDDAVLAKVVKVLDWFSVVNPKGPKA